jgi:pheromone shutdown protein TraB
MDEETLQWLFIFAAVQTEMAKSRNAYAGEDMLAGIEAAYELEIPVYPIDMHMSVTMTGAKEAIGGSLTQFQKCLGTLYAIQDLLSSLNPRLFLKNPALLLEEYIKILKMSLVGIRAAIPLFSTPLSFIISIASSSLHHPIFVIKFIVNSFRPLLHSRNLFQIFFGFFSTVISTLLTLAISSNRGINAMRSLFKFSPEIYSAMLEEREEFMSQQIFKMSEEHDRIVVITGAAHLTGLEEKIREKMPDAKIETINFVDLL